MKSNGDHAVQEGDHKKNSLRFAEILNLLIEQLGPFTSERDQVQQVHRVATGIGAYLKRSYPQHLGKCKKPKTYTSRPSANAIKVKQPDRTKH